MNCLTANSFQFITDIVSQHLVGHPITDHDLAGCLRAFFIRAGKILQVKVSVIGQAKGIEWMLICQEPFKSFQHFFEVLNDLAGFVGYEKAVIIQENVISLQRSDAGFVIPEEADLFPGAGEAFLPDQFIKGNNGSCTCIKMLLYLLFGKEPPAILVKTCF